MSERGKSKLDQLESIKEVLAFDPKGIVLVLLTGLLAALLEGIGLSFIMPVIELAQSGGGEQSQFVAIFASAYETVGIPFTLETVIIGVAIVIAIRYATTFTSTYLSQKLGARYERDLKDRAFRRSLDASVRYYDNTGSDEMLNSVITETDNAGSLITVCAKFFRIVAVSIIYLAIAVYIAPLITLLSLVLLGGVTYVVRYVIEPAYTVGDRVADANQEIQNAVQTGTQGARDVKLFGMHPRLLRRFTESVDNYVSARVSLDRNTTLIRNFYDFMSATTIFVLIYVALTFTSLSLSSLAVFLFAMYRLAPRASNINNMIYSIEGQLPHLIRSQEFIEELAAVEESDDGDTPLPETVTEVRYENVTFGYSDDEPVIEDVSFKLERGDLAAFVGPSGVGKSTVVSLLARMYEPDRGRIETNGTAIWDYPLADWRDRLAYVQQHPYIFNESLRYNVMVGNPDATDKEFRRACELACIDEFLDELDDGYDTNVGDDGVLLSGGQRQRVALARAILKDADVFILDEATSEMDASLEQDIYDAINEIREDNITLVIAHRLSTIIDSDCIYTMEEGTIVERGGHDTLMEGGGAYANMYNKGLQ